MPGLAWHRHRNALLLLRSTSSSRVQENQCTSMTTSTEYLRARSAAAHHSHQSPHILPLFGAGCYDAQSGPLHGQVRLSQSESQPTPAFPSNKAVRPSAQRSRHRRIGSLIPPTAHRQPESVYRSLPSCITCTPCNPTLAVGCEISHQALNPLRDLSNQCCQLMSREPPHLRIMRWLAFLAAKATRSHVGPGSMHDAM